MRAPLLGTIAALATIISCWGQQTPTSTPNVTDMLTMLHSGKWLERQHAFEQLRSDRTAIRSPKVQAALLSLLDLENQVLASDNRKAQSPGYKDKYGEAYAEYSAQLGDTIQSFVDWKDPRQVCILVNQGYDPDSQLAARIADHGKIAVPCLVQLSKSDLGAYRGESVPILVQILTKKKDDLDPDTAQAIKQVVLTALHDSDIMARSFTIDALGKYGTEDMIPALKAVAETDPSPEVQGHSIRKSAAEAIASIEKRTGRQ